MKGKLEKTIKTVNKFNIIAILILFLVIWFYI